MGGWLPAVAAIPVLTVIVALATDALLPPDTGWLPLVALHLVFLAYGAFSANLWEELARAGLVQPG